MISEYYWLTKPGIIYGNIITAAAGFFLAAKGQVDFQLLMAALIGLAFIIASSCVINNIYDRDIDARMPRTQSRAMVAGTIPKRNAIIFAVALGILGILILSLYTNHLTLSVALSGMLVYVLLYTPLKSRTVHATLIGSISGATPPVVGYTAVANQLDLATWLLFAILVVWQMPHFYTIAIRRIEEYRAAGIPVLPVKTSIRVAKHYITFYIILFIIAAYLFYHYGYTGKIYLWVMMILAGDWLVNSLRGYSSGVDDIAWAKKMFYFSLVVLLAFSMMISIDAII